MPDHSQSPSPGDQPDAAASDGAPQVTPATATGSGGPAADKAEVRLFFAWQPDESTLESLTGWQQRLARSRQVDQGVRWLAPAQLHVTALFLGAVEPELVEGLTTRAAGAIAAAGLAAPVIELDRLAFFPRRSRPRVLVLAGVATNPLKVWHRTLRQAMLELVPAVQRPLPFKPHVTLGRLTAHQAAGAKLARVREPLTWQAGPLTLMESRPRPGGTDYVTVWSQPGTP